MVTMQADIFLGKGAIWQVVLDDPAHLIGSCIANITAHTGREMGSFNYS